MEKLFWSFKNKSIMLNASSSVLISAKYILCYDYYDYAV